MSSPANVALQSLALWKRLTSYFKRSWDLADYPILVRRQQSTEPSDNSESRLFSWTAIVINWPGMVGGGGTRDEALEDLRKNFEIRRTNNPELPRPGENVPIKFSSTGRVDQFPKLGQEFITQVLGLEWAWISDESSLWDFPDTENHPAIFGKIQAIYGVDVSDISDGNLARIFERIAANGSETPGSKLPNQFIGKAVPGHA